MKVKETETRRLRGVDSDVRAAKTELKAVEVEIAWIVGVVHEDHARKVPIALRWY